MEWAVANLGRIIALSGQHLLLALVPLLLGLVIAVPLAQLVRRTSWLRSLLLTVSSVLYTVPSLALFIILPAILGTRILDPANVIVALTVYSLALLLRTSLDALDSVDRDLSQAATALGHTAVSRFALVDLPLSLPVMIAGLRAVSVSNISLVSVAALVGIPNLGVLFTEGLQRDFPEEILVGLVVIVLLALLMDALLVLAGRLLAPWASLQPGRAGADDAHVRGLVTRTSEGGA